MIRPALSAWIAVSAAFLACHPAQAGKLALILGAEPDWASAISDFQSGAQARGYKTFAVVDSPEHPVTRASALSALEDLVEHAGKQDQVWISLQCHGGVLGGVSGEHRDENHYCCLNSKCSESLLASELRSFASRLAGNNVKLIVTDHSCTGGGTVRALADVPGVCAIATTGEANPSIVGFPNFGTALGDTHLRNFEDLARDANFKILKKLPSRLFQHGYESRCSNMPMRLREGVEALSSLGLSGPTPQAKLMNELAKPEIDWHEVTWANISFSLESGDSCKVIKEAQRQLSEPLMLMAMLAQDGFVSKLYENSLPAVLARYRENEIALPFDRIKTMAGLTNEINASITRLKQLREGVDQTLQRLNGQIDNLVRIQRQASDSDGEFLAKVSVQRERQGVLDAQSRIEDEEARLSRVLSVYEDLDCGLRPSPCRDLDI